MLTELYYIREEKNMTLRELSIKSGISKSSINNIENGKRIPRIDTVCRLAYALNIKPELLFSRLIEGEHY